MHRRGWKKNRAHQEGGEGGDRDAGRDDAMGSGSAQPEDHDYGEGDGTGDEPGHSPSPSDLHHVWQGEVALVKRLRQQGIGEAHPAMLAACHARDAAERQWREAKDPTPPTLRLSRAQAKLDKAISLQAESRMALVEHERVFKERQAALQAKLDEDTARVRSRRQQLEDIQEEFALGGRVGRARAAQGAAVRKVHGALCNEIAPTIATLVEQLDSATPAWGILNSLLATLTSSKALLEEAMPAQGAQAFDIADDAGDCDDCDHDGHDGGNESEWSESHEVADDVDGGVGDRVGGDGDGPSDGMDVGDDEDDWWGGSRNNWQGTTRWAPSGYGKWARTSWADCWEHEQQGGRGSSDGDQPPPARRRLDDRNSTAVGPGAPAAAAAEGAGATGADHSARLHSERVELITQRAIDAGIQPITHLGEDLRVLDSNALDAWAAEHLPEGAQG